MCVCVYIYIYGFFADLTKECVILIDLQENSDNYLPFFLQSDFKKNCVTILVCKDFCDQQVSNPSDATSLFNVTN